MRAAWRNGPQARWADAFATVFQRAAARGETTSAAGTSLAAEAGPGIFLLRWAVTDADVTEALATAVVCEVMLPLLRKQ